MFWPLAAAIKKNLGKTRVTADCKNLNDCDIFFDVLYERKSDALLKLL
jgi:hypothetical protein